MRTVALAARGTPVRRAASRPSTTMRTEPRIAPVGGVIRTLALRVASQPGAESGSLSSWAAVTAGSGVSYGLSPCAARAVAPTPSPARMARGKARFIPRR